VRNLIVSRAMVRTLSTGKRTVVAPNMHSATTMKKHMKGLSRGNLVGVDTARMNVDASTKHNKSELKELGSKAKQQRKVALQRPGSKDRGPLDMMSSRDTPPGSPREAGDGAIHKVFMLKSKANRMRTLQEPKNSDLTPNPSPKTNSLHGCFCFCFFWGSAYNIEIELIGKVLKGVELHLYCVPQIE
jgi:hypothetical protein